MDLINHEDGHPIGQPSQVTRENIPTGKLQAVLGLFEHLADIGCPSTIISSAHSRAGHSPGSRELLEICVSSLGDQSS